MSSWIPKDLHIYTKFRKYKNKLLRGGRQPEAVTTMDVPKPMLMSLVFTKGLSNNAGENNCFLNSAVQILWHLDVFRKNFNLLSYHACLENSCIFCGLKVIFTQFQHSEEKVLPPDALRQALAVAFEDQQKFQLGLMGDAAECFENILTRIHFHLSNGDMEDYCTLPHCISHQKFAMMLIEQVVCECGETSEPLPFVQLVHYVTAHAIINLSHKNKAVKSFGHMLRLAHSDGNLRNKCPSKCGRHARIERSLTNVPDVISIGLIWDSDQQSTDHVRKFFEAVGTELHLVDLFDSVVDAEQAQVTVEHKLVGMVCYYGKHYSAFLLHSKSNSWKSCDDAKVTEIGPNWSDVVEKCSRGRYQPLLLLYQNPKASLISLKSAPKTMTILTSCLPNDSQPTAASDMGRGSSPSDVKASDRSRQSDANKYSGTTQGLPSSPGNCNLSNNNVLTLNEIHFDRGSTVTPSAPPAPFSRSGLKPSVTRPTEPPDRLLMKRTEPSIVMPRPSLKPSSERSNLLIRPSEPPRPLQSGSSHSLPRSSDSERKCLSSQMLADSNKRGSNSCIPSLLSQHPHPALDYQPLHLNASHITQNTTFSTLNSPNIRNGNAVASYEPRYEMLPSQRPYVVYNGGAGPLNRWPYQSGTVPLILSSHVPSFSSSFPGRETVPNSSCGMPTGPMTTPLPQHPLVPLSGYSQMCYGGCTGVVVPKPDANLQVAVVACTSVTNQPDNVGGDYSKAGNQLDVVVLNEGRMTSDTTWPTAPSSEMNLMDWSIIDKKMLPSPDSDSTSSQYDNLLDFLSIDDKTSCQATLSAKGVPLVARNESLTESYFIVPDAQHLDDMADDKDLTREADQLIEQSRGKENCGDMQAALICCNQAINLYAMARKESSNRPGTDDLELKEKIAYSRSKYLLQQIDFNQQKSKTDTKNKISATTGISHQTPGSPTTTHCAQDLLIFSEDHSKLSVTPQYQAVLDNLPHLYSQNNRGAQYHWVSK